MTAELLVEGLRSNAIACRLFPEPPMLRFASRAAILVAAFVCTALPVRAQSSPTDLARGLRDNGMPDLALEYLDDLAKGKLSPDVLAVLPLERARARLELANDEPERGKRDALIARARAEFDQFLKANANHPRRAEAAISLARLLSVQAKAMLSDSNKLDDNKARKADAAKARPVFTDAGNRFKEAAAEFAEKAKDPTLTATQKRAALNDVYQARLDQALNMFQLSRTYDPPEGVAEIQKRAADIKAAKDLFTKVTEEDLQSPYYWIAKAWTGECEKDLDAPVESQNIFAGIKLAATKSPAAAAGARLVKFFEARIDFEKALSDGSFRKAQNNLEVWLGDPANRSARPTPERFSARFYIAVCKDRQGRALVRLNPEKKPIFPLPGDAVSFLKQAEKDYKRLIEPENDYSTRAAERHTQVLLLLIGDGEKSPALIQNFDEALMSAQVQLYKAVKEDKDAEQLKLMVKASAFYERAMQLPVPKDMERDLVDAQTNLAYTYLRSDRQMQAAVLAENIARTTRQSSAAARAGMYAVQSYLQAAEKLAPADNEGRRVDKARAVRLAYFLDKQFPTDPSTDAARVTLGSLLIQDQKFVESFDVASRVGTNSPKTYNARLVQGVAAFELLKPVPKDAEVDVNKDIKPEKKAEIFQRVIADLKAIPSPAASATYNDANLYSLCTIQLIELYLLDKPNGYPKAEAEAKAAQPRIDAFTGLTADEKTVYKFKLEHARLRAIYGQAVPLFQTGKYAEVNQKIAPPLGDVLKDGPAVKAGQEKTVGEAAKRVDDFRRETLIVLALQTRIREGAVDKAGELFDMLKKLGGTLESSVDALGQLIAAAKPQIDTLIRDKKPEEADKIIKGIGLVLDKVAAEKNISPRVLLFLGTGLKDIGNYEKAAETLKKMPAPDTKLLEKKIAELNPETELKPVLFYRRSRLELARTYRLSKQYAEADAVLKDPIGTKDKPGWAATAPDFRKEVALLLEAKGANATDPKEAYKNWAEAKQKWTELANEQYRPLGKLQAGKKDGRSAFMALLELKKLPPDASLPTKPPAKKGDPVELDEKKIREALANSKPTASQQWITKLLIERELDANGKPVVGPDGKVLDPPYVVQLKNTVARLDNDFKPAYHELFYEATRCLVHANAQILKGKPTELAAANAKAAKQIYDLRVANPDLSAEVRTKFDDLMNENDGALRKEYAKVAALAIYDVYVNYLVREAEAPKKFEEEKKRIESEEAKKPEDDKKKADEAKKLIEDAKKQLEDDRRQFEEDKKKFAEEKIKLEKMMDENGGEIRKEFAKLEAAKPITASASAASNDTSTTASGTKTATAAQADDDSTGLIIGGVVGVLCLVGVAGFLVFGRKKKAPARRRPPTMTIDAE